jgi:hypothetical protein
VTFSGHHQQIVKPTQEIFRPAAFFTEPGTFGATDPALHRIFIEAAKQVFGLQLKIKPVPKIISASLKAVSSGRCLHDPVDGPELDVTPFSLRHGILKIPHQKLQIAGRIK